MTGKEAKDGAAVKFIFVFLDCGIYSSIVSYMNY